MSLIHVKSLNDGSNMDQHPASKLQVALIDSVPNLPNAKPVSLAARLANCLTSRP